jgi:hypothetical protein
MDASAIHYLIKKLQMISGSNDKKDILRQYTLSPTLHKYLQYVYDEVNYVWGKSKLPIIADAGIDLALQDETLVEFYALLDDMNSGELKGNASDQAIQDYLVGKEPHYEDLLFYVIKRDIKAKIGAKAINDTIGRIIPIAPYMRCESESYMAKRIVYETDGVNHGALAQSKADGAFNNVHLLLDCDDVECTTRYGREVPTNKFLESLSVINEIMGYTEEKVIHGELLLKHPDGSIMDRQTGNGKINKYAKRYSTGAELQKKYNSAKSDKAKLKIEQDIMAHQKDWEYIAQNLVYEIWDVVPYDDWINLDCSIQTLTRFQETVNIVDRYNKYIQESDRDIGNCEVRLIDHAIVKNEDEAMQFYQEQLDKDLEGMVIKNLYIPWTHDTNRGGIIKLKDFKENDLIILGYNMADEDSTFVGGIGSLIMESSDGLLKVNVSGMKRHDRGLEPVDPDDSSKGLRVIPGFDFDQFTGKIAAVKYNEVIKSKNNDFYSMFLPNVLEVRSSSDKTQADDFIKIKKDAKYKG